MWTIIIDRGKNLEIIATIFVFSDLTRHWEKINEKRIN